MKLLCFALIVLLGFAELALGSHNDDIDQTSVDMTQDFQCAFAAFSLVDTGDVCQGEGKVRHGATPSENFEIFKASLDSLMENQMGDDELLKVATMKDRQDIVRFILDREGNARAGINEALWIAAMNGNIEIASYLLQSGADLHAMDDEAMIIAADNGRLEIIKLLLNHGANAHVRNDEALRAAAGNGHLDIVDLLVYLGANVNAEEDEALWSAAVNGHTKMAMLLVKHGANVHARDNRALLAAVKHGHVEIVGFLLESGADVNANQGETLRWAIKNDHHEIVKLCFGRLATIPKGVGFAVLSEVLRPVETLHTTILYSSKVPGIDKPTTMDISGQYWFDTAALIAEHPEAFASTGFRANIDKASDEGGPCRTLVDALNTYLITGNPFGDEKRKRDPFLFMKDDSYYLEIFTSPEMAFMIGMTLGKGFQLGLSLPIKVDAQLFHLLQQFDQAAIHQYYDKIYPARFDELYGRLYKGFIDVVTAELALEDREKKYAELLDPENGICVYRVDGPTLGDLGSQSNVLTTSNDIANCITSYDEYTIHREQLLGFYRETFLMVLAQLRGGLAHFLNDWALSRLETLDIIKLFYPKSLTNEDILEKLVFGDCHYEVESMIPGVKITMENALRDFVGSLTTIEQRRRLVQMFTGSENTFLGSIGALKFHCLGQSLNDPIPNGFASSEKPVKSVFTNESLMELKVSAIKELAAREKITCYSCDFRCSDLVLPPFSHTCLNLIGIPKQSQADIFCALGSDMQYDCSTYTTV